MTLLGMVRHGSTEWNELGRAQSRSDIPMSNKGRYEVQHWQLPIEYLEFDWVASPLVRSIETAKILKGCTVPTDDRLLEMDWAEWEGKHLEELRDEIGDLRAAWREKGIDFRAPGGESPRDVQVRLMSFFEERAAAPLSTIAVCHRGVIRATYALATDWDMMSEPVHQLADNCIHLFQLAPNGFPSLHKLNISLDCNAGS